MRYVGRKSPVLTYPTSIWRLRCVGVTALELRRDLWRQKTVYRTALFP